MKRKIASTGPSKNFLSQIETPCVSSYMAYAIWELVPTWLRVPIWSGTSRPGRVKPVPVRDGRPKTGIILTLRESRGERLFSLFIFQSSLKVDDEINLNS